MNDIKDFRIGTAFYFLENKGGSRLKLTLNYNKNSFTIRVLKVANDVEKLKNQAQTVANNLLGKKAQRNLAYKLLKLEESK